MAEQEKEEFLDEVEESELDQDELIDIDAEAAELEKLDEVTAERDDYRDRFMRALADAENARKRADKDRKEACLLYTSPSPRDRSLSRMPSSA